MVTLDRYPEGRRDRLIFALKAARAINPMNDWVLARLVAAQFIAVCVFVIALKF